MPKLRRQDTEDLDIQALEAVEYSTERVDRYYGEVPPPDIELTGYVKRMYWTRTAIKEQDEQGNVISGDDPMLKILFVAAENNGDYAQFNDCPFWLNAPLIAAAKFRWAPFLDNFGISLRDVKTDTHVKDVDDQNGWPIERIGQFVPGEDSDDAWCRIITEQEPYQGTMQARVGVWLPWDEDEGEEGEGEEGEPDEGEDEPEEPEDEEPEAPAPAARGRRGAQPAARASGARSRTTTAGKSARPAAASSGAARRTPGRGGKGRTTSATPAGRRGGGKRSTAGSNEPPF